MVGCLHNVAIASLHLESPSANAPSMQPLTTLRGQLDCTPSRTRDGRHDDDLDGHVWGKDQKGGGIAKPTNLLTLHLECVDEQGRLGLD